MESQFQPYRRGWETSAFRLAEKVTVVTTTITASAAPKMADRTGTALRPMPGSRAKRTPVTADSGNPSAAAALVTFDVRPSAP